MKVSMEKEMVASIERNGFLDLPIDPKINLEQEILRLKKEKNAIILGHFYITPDLQDISDFIGDERSPEALTTTCTSISSRVRNQIRTL